MTFFFFFFGGGGGGTTFLFNFSHFSFLSKALLDPGPEIVIADEGHRIKSRQAVVSHLVKEIRTQRLIIMIIIICYYLLLIFVPPFSQENRSYWLSPSK